MSIVMVDIAFALVVATAGIATGWYLCRGGARRKAGEHDTQIKRAREVLSRLHDLATDVAADVGLHSDRVEEINEELTAAAGDEPEAVANAVDKLVQANNQMRHELAAAEDRLQEQAQLIETHATAALTDALTRLPNRRAFDDEGSRRLAEFRRQGKPFSVMILDVDLFKNFNDTHGHRAGDEVLRGVGRVLRKKAREMDLPARYGGEEFAMILPATSAPDANQAAERVREAIDASRVRFECVELHVTTSVGVAEILPDEDVPALMQRADEALYAAKGAGRNCGHWHDGNQIHPIRAEEPAAAEETAAEEVTPEPPEPPRGQPDVIGRQSVCDRGTFCATLGRRLAERKRGGDVPSVLLARVDRLQTIVSKHGKRGAESVLQATTKFLNAALRDMDLVARYDDATFAVLLPRTDFASTVRVAERLREAVARCALPLGTTNLKFTISLSAAEATEGDSLSGLLTRSEEALDAALKSGGNCTYFHNGAWSEMASAVLERTSQ